MNMKKKKKILVSLFVDDGNTIRANVVESGVAGAADRLHSVVQMSVVDSYFYLYLNFSETRNRSECECEMGGEPLEMVSGSGCLKFGGHQLVASLGEEAAAYRIACIVDESDSLKLPVWQDVFRALPVSRAVSMAVADSRLAPHLSPEAAVVYAAEHSDLVESGWML